MISHSSISDVCLDTLKESELYTILKWRNDPAVFNWCRQRDIIDESTHKEWFNKKDPSIKMYSIRTLTDQLLGVCGLTDIDLFNQRAEFSLYVAPEFQQKGFGKDALKLLCWHGFNTYPFIQIWGESFAKNPARNMFLKIGFKEYGYRPDFYFKEGRFTDCYLYSMHRGDLKLDA